MSRPATFQCTWCGKTKALARTGRMPRFCSDWCRRQPVQAEFQLRNAIAHRDSAQRTIDYLTANLERYRALELAVTESGARPPAETRSRVAIDAEGVPA